LLLSVGSGGGGGGGGGGGPGWEPDHSKRAVYFSLSMVAGRGSQRNVVNLG
jgi:hypothetical protein